MSICLYDISQDCFLSHCLALQKHLFNTLSARWFMEAAACLLQGYCRFLWWRLAKKLCCISEFLYMLRETNSLGPFSSIILSLITPCYGSLMGSCIKVNIEQPQVALEETCIFVQAIDYYC